MRAGWTAVAALTCLALAGCREREPTEARAPSPPPSPPVAAWFVEEAQQRGLDFKHASGHQERYLLPEITSGGVALFDMDQDGDLDAYFVQGGCVTCPATRRPPNRLYRNRGDGLFEDITEGSGADDRGYGNGVACGDYDNDGDVDLYVTNLGTDVLLRNDGDGQFRSVGRSAGLVNSSWTTSASFVDYDGDGDLDLFVATYLGWTEALERSCPRPHGGPDYCNPAAYAAPLADLLYRNDGDGTFTDVSFQLGDGELLGSGLGVLCADFDADGRIDLFVANDGMANRLWMNQGAGRFEERAMPMGCAVDEEGHPKAGMGVAAADLDGDGDTDLLVGNLAGEADSLFLNERHYQELSFRDVTSRSGLAGRSRSFTRFGLGLFDFDHDGRFDVFEANGRVTRPPRVSTGDPYAERNLLLRGLPQLRFEEQGQLVAGVGSLTATSRGAAFGDVDGDGRVDVLIVNRDGPAQLLRNIRGDGGHACSISVRDRHGRAALGATLELELPDGRVLFRQVNASGSYQASSDPRVHVGLGALQRVNSVRVRWATGETESFEGFPAGDGVTLRQGAGRALGAAPRD